MKKIITQNDEHFYEATYILSKNNWALYTNNRKDYKSLTFFKKNLYHRNCDLGPQSKNKYYIMYKEKNNFHNLYGYAFIDILANVKTYSIYDNPYNSIQFNKYISLYNNLTYKRIY